MLHNIQHDTNIAATSTSNIQNIQLDETRINAEREDPLSSNEEDMEAQLQTPKKKRKRYKHRQTTEHRNKTNSLIQGKETTRGNNSTQ